MSSEEYFGYCCLRSPVIFSEMSPLSRKISLWPSLPLLFCQSPQWFITSCPPVCVNLPSRRKFLIQPLGFRFFDFQFQLLPFTRFPRRTIPLIVSLIGEYIRSGQVLIAWTSSPAHSPPAICYSSYILVYRSEFADYSDNFSLNSHFCHKYGRHCGVCRFQTDACRFLKIPFQRGESVFQ